MKIVLNVKEKEPKKNDIIVYKDGQWVVISKESFLAGVFSEIHKLQEGMSEMKSDLVNLAEIVKEK